MTLTTREIIHKTALDEGWEKTLDTGSKQNDRFVRGNESISVWYTRGRAALWFATRSDARYTESDHVRSQNYAQVGDYTRNKKEIVLGWLREPATEAPLEDRQPALPVATDAINEVLSKSGLYESFPNAPRIQNDQDTDGIIHLVAYLAGTADGAREMARDLMKQRDAIRNYLGTE